MASRFKYILCIALMSVGVMYAEGDNYSYGKFGTGFPDLLNGGVGYRTFQGRHGFDVSLSAGSCVLLTDVNMKGLYLHRFSPYSYSTFYCGLGLGANYMYIMDFCRDTQQISPSIETVFGKSWTLDSGRINFLQLTGSVTFSDKDPRFFPLVRLEYGISF